MAEENQTRLSNILKRLSGAAVSDEELQKISEGMDTNKFGVGSLFGGVGQAMGDKLKAPFKFDVRKFMTQQFEEEGIQPKIIGESPDGQSFVIETPMGGSMIISLKDFIHA